jgi:hypothetical protein
MKNTINLIPSFRKNNLAISDEASTFLDEIVSFCYWLDDLIDTRGKANSDIINEIHANVPLLFTNTSKLRDISNSLSEYIALQLFTSTDKFNPKNLFQYLDCSSRTLGTVLIYDYVTRELVDDREVVHGKLARKLQTLVDSFLRLANDYIDISTEVNRITNEKSQIKSYTFIKSKHLYEVILLLYYMAIKFIFCMKPLISYNKKLFVYCNVVQSVFEFGIDMFYLRRDSGRVRLDANAQLEP